MSNFKGGAGARTHCMACLFACTQSVLRWWLFHFTVTVQLKMGVLHHVILIVTVFSSATNAQTPCETKYNWLCRWTQYFTPSPPPPAPLSDPYCSPACGSPTDRTPVTFGCQVSVETDKCSDLNVWLVNKTAVNASSPRYSITNQCSGGRLTTSLTFAMNESNYGCYRCGDTSTFTMTVIEQTITCYEPVCIGTGCNLSSPSTQPWTTLTFFSPCVLLMAVFVVCCVALFACTVSYRNHWVIGANQQKYSPCYYKIDGGQSIHKIWLYMFVVVWHSVYSFCTYWWL